MCIKGVFWFSSCKYRIITQDKSIKPFCLGRSIYTLGGEHILWRCETKSFHISTIRKKKKKQINAANFRKKWYDMCSKISCTCINWRRRTTAREYIKNLTFSFCMKTASQSRLLSSVWPFQNPKGFWFWSSCSCNQQRLIHTSRLKF